MIKSLRSSLLLTAVLCLSVTVGAQTVRFVDSVAGNNANTGLTWGTALQTIHQAVQVAAPSDSIYVKEGTILITSPIYVNKALSIYGGFAGTESSPSERNLVQHATTVDGQNLVIHVFQFDSTTGVLDGFTARRGYANGTGTGTVGGGFLGYNSTLQVRNCTFRDSYATLGGGGFDTWLCNLTVENCRFVANSSVAGGGVRCRESTSSFTNCVLEQNNSNVTNGKGGGMYFWNSTVTVAGCTFSNNQSRVGGGISTSGGSLVVGESTFSTNNGVSQGGGIHVTGGYLAVDGCTFRSGVTTLGGGIAGLTLSAGSNVVACRFFDNRSDRGGGLYFSASSDVDVINCVIVGNEGVRLGGGIYMQTSTVAINHCTVAQNVSDRGAGCYTDAASHPSIHNSIFWNNSVTSTNATRIATKEFAAAVTPMPYVVTYTDVQQSGFAGSNGNLNVNPQFISPGFLNDAGTPADLNDDFFVDGNYTLPAGSPCIDVAMVASGVIDDFAGNVRPQGAGPDMGAYELSAADTVAPSLLSASILPTSGTLLFSEAMAGLPASSLFNYTLTPAGSVDSATPSGAQVTLAVTHPADGVYSLTVQNLTDLAGNPLPSTVVGYTIDTTAPLVPGPLSGTPTTSSVALSWPASSDLNGLADYQVYRDGVLIATTSATTLDDAGLQPGTDYLYRVVATDTFGNTAEASLNVATIAAPTYTLSIFATGGFVDVSPLKTSYLAGDVVTLTAIPDGGQTFNHWEGDLVGTQNPTVIVISADASVTAVFVAEPSGISPVGLQAQWHFDEAAGNSSWDSSGLGNHAVLQNGTIWSTGVTGSAVTFDGINDSLDLGSSTFGLSTDLSLSLWCKATVVGTRMVLVQRGAYVSPFVLNIESSRKVRFGVRTLGGTATYLTSNAVLNANTWYHITVTFTSGQRSIYINGQLDKSDALTGALDLGAAGTLTTAGLNPLGTSPFTGAIDEMRLYSRVLTPTEVLWLYQNGL